MLHVSSRQPWRPRLSAASADAVRMAASFQAFSQRDYCLVARSPRIREVGHLSHCPSSRAVQVDPGCQPIIHWKPSPMGVFRGRCEVGICRQTQGNDLRHSVSREEGPSLVAFCKTPLSPGVAGHDGRAQGAISIQVLALQEFRGSTEWFASTPNHPRLACAHLASTHLGTSRGSPHLGPTAATPGGPLHVLGAKQLLGWPATP